MDTIPPQQSSQVAPSPRVQPPMLPTHTSPPSASPRLGPPIVLFPSSIPISALQMRRKKLKNARFTNTLPHQYQIRSRTKHNSRHTPGRYGTNFKQFAAQHLTTQHVYQHKVQHIFQPNGKRETIDSIINGPNHATWIKILSNERGRLAQGKKCGVNSSNTISFIHKQELPSDIQVTYATYVCDYKPLKGKKFQL